MKILLIKAFAETHGYSQFVNSLHRAFAELGHETAVSDQAARVAQEWPDPTALAGELLAGRYDAVLSIGSFFGGVALTSGQSLFDALGVKFMGWQLEHPIYAPQCLARALQNRCAIYSNENHLRFADAIRTPGRRMAMLPGADPMAAPLTDYQRREWPVFVAATWNGLPQPVWNTLEDSPAKRLLVGVVDRLASDRAASLLDAFDDTSQQLGLGARLGADPVFDDQMVAFLRRPLTYLRQLDRIRTVEALADSGVRMALLGSGWREHLGERSNVEYLDGRVDFAALPGLYNRAKVVINLNAGNGASERAVSAAMAGAAVVSDYSAHLGELFSAAGIGFFDRARSGHVAEVVADLLESEAGEMLAQHGYESVSRHGSWRHRAAQMAEFLEAA